MKFSKIIMFSNPLGNRKKVVSVRRKLRLENEEAVQTPLFYLSKKSQPVTSLNLPNFDSNLDSATNLKGPLSPQNYFAMATQTQEVLSPSGLVHGDLPDLMKSKKSKLQNIMTELTPILKN